MMNRRTFLCGLTLGTLVAPLAAEAQPAGKVARIGFLSPSSLSDPRTQIFVEAFLQGLRDRGWISGQNMTIEYRWAEERTERLPELATDLANLKVDVLVAATSPAVQAAKIATVTIPIVMTNAGDAVATGFVTSIARPNTNITGLSMMGGELVGKQLQILKEVVPNLARVALLWNPSNSSNAPQLRHAEDAVRTLRLRLQPVEVNGPGDIEAAFARMIKGHAGGVIVLLDSMLAANRSRIAELATKSRLPTIYGLTDHAKAGGLITYGPNVAEMYRRSAVYVDKILKGSRVSDLPVEQPTMFELVINLRTAKAVGITIPPSVVGRADQVIDP
jgi:ABC-type uncharacterized transport system substrate-binding protein